MKKSEVFSDMSELILMSKKFYNKTGYIFDEIVYFLEVNGEITEAFDKNKFHDATGLMPIDPEFYEMGLNNEK